MSAPEIEELRTKMTALDRKIDDQQEMMKGLDRTLGIILASLRKCQRRCHVDNPPGRWRTLGRAIVEMFKSNNHQLTEMTDG
jgi:hypothetical protein